MPLHTHTHNGLWHQGSKATDMVISHPENLVVCRFDKSASSSITHPGQLEPLWPHPADRRLAEESWSFSWKLLSERGEETERRRKRGIRNVTTKRKDKKGRCFALTTQVDRQWWNHWLSHWSSGLKRHVTSDSIYKPSSRHLSNQRSDSEGGQMLRTQDVE